MSVTALSFAAVVVGLAAGSVAEPAVARGLPLGVTGAPFVNSGAALAAESDAALVAESGRATGADEAAEDEVADGAVERPHAGLLMMVMTKASHHQRGGCEGHARHARSDPSNLSIDEF